MLDEAASTGVGHLLLSPWINLVPVDAAPDEARLVCQVQNEALARLVAAHPGGSARSARSRCRIRPWPRGNWRT